MNADFALNRQPYTVSSLFVGPFDHDDDRGDDDHDEDDTTTTATGPRRAGRRLGGPDLAASSRRGAQRGDQNHGSDRSMNSGSPVLRDISSCICACSAAGGSFCSPSRAAASEVK